MATINNSEDCIICLNDEEMETNNSILPIDNIHELKKTCECNYNVHKKCIEEWITNNPVCIICNEPLYYISSDIHHEIHDSVQIIHNIGDIYDGHYNDEDADDEVIYHMPSSNCTYFSLSLCIALAIFVIVYNTM